QRLTEGGGLPAPEAGNGAPGQQQDPDGEGGRQYGTRKFEFPQGIEADVSSTAACVMVTRVVRE
ncbi:MAG: hypothetical protein VYB45_09720, partial [Pseudomonadota bacterium]|nr:hypothetical protein [Pseudomonadota bacterium]